MELLITEFLKVNNGNSRQEKVLADFRRERRKFSQRRTDQHFFSGNLRKKSAKICEK